MRDETGAIKMQAMGSESRLQDETKSSQSPKKDSE